MESLASVSKGIHLRLDAQISLPAPTDAEDDYQAEKDR